MRFVLAMVLAGLVGFPRGASAQDPEESAAPEPLAEEPAPAAEPAPEEPALQLKLDSAGIDVAPSPPRTVGGYSLEEAELRVRRAKIGLGVSIGVLLAGAVMTGTGIARWDLCLFTPPEECDSGLGLAWAGVAFMVGGFFAVIGTAVALRRRNRDLATLREAHYGRPRRAQWELARSRLVF
jgi:hypothetical protein